MFGFVQSEKTVSVLLQVALLNEFFLVTISLCGTPWQMVTPEMMLTKKVTADREGAGTPLSRIGVERAPEVERRRFSVMSAGIEAHGHTGGCAALASHGRATKPHNDECRGRIRTIIERTVTGRARMNAYKDRIALELGGVQEMCPRYLGTEMMSRWQFDTRTHLAVTSQKNSTKTRE